MTDSTDPGDHRSGRQSIRRLQAPKTGASANVAEPGAIPTDGAPSDVSPVANHTHRPAPIDEVGRAGGDVNDPDNWIKVGLGIATIALLGGVGYLLWIALAQIQLPPFPAQPSTEPADVFGAYLIRVGLLIMVVSAAIGLATQLLGLWVTAKEALTIKTFGDGFKSALGAASELVKVPAGIGFLILSVGGILMFGEALAPAEP